MSRHWFAFCNPARDKVKILQWTGTGFWLSLYSQLGGGISPGFYAVISVRTESRALIGAC